MTIRSKTLVPIGKWAPLAAKRNGGRHRCQPPLRRAKDLPVFDRLGSRSGKPVCDPASRSWLTSSGVASHRTAPSFEEPDRSTRLRGPKVRWSFDRSGPASGTEIPRSQNRPMFRGPSWDDLSRVSLCSPKSTRNFGNRVARQEDHLFRRLFPAGPVKARRLLPLPAGGDRTLGRPPRRLAVAGLPTRPGPQSRSPTDHAPLNRVAKAKNVRLTLWITWISGTIAGTLSLSRFRPGIGCRSVPCRLLRASA